MQQVIGIPTERAGTKGELRVYVIEPQEIAEMEFAFPGGGCIYGVRFEANGETAGLEPA